MQAITKLEGPFAAIAMTIPTILLVAQSSHVSSITPRPSILRWSHGDPALRLLPADKGFCYVSGMGGDFQGGGESVRVWIDDGTWWVGGYSCQPSLWVEVTCMEWPAAGSPKR
jgi:hypothetical protein